MISMARQTESVAMTRFQHRLLAAIICSQAVAAVGEDALPSIELLQLLGEWQPDNDQWLEQLQRLDNVIAASEGELVESPAPAAGSPEAEPTPTPAELNESQEQEQ